MSSGTDISRRRLVALALLLGLVAYGLFWGRRIYVRSWFEQGPARPPAVLKVSTPDGPPRRARVLLLDGLSLEQADRLPALSRLCQRGLALRVDVGWPSVSLPVQHVLWTGTWQTRSGVMFAVKRLERPVFESLPDVVARRSGNAVAIAQREPHIVSSFPFSRIIGPREEKAWLSPLELSQQSLEAVQSSAALVLIHFLAVDEAGHRVGAGGAEYREAARRGDALLSQLLEVLPRDATLLVLADHGHLRAPPGGHGGPEPAVDQIRACLVGPGVPAGRRARAVLPDLTRILADQLNVAPPRRCQGRTLAALLRGEPAATQQLSWTPRAGLAAALLVAGWLGLLLWGRRRGLRPVLLLPWGAALGLLLVVLVRGNPTLSRFFVYRGLPWPLWPAALPAVILPVLQLWLLLRGGASVGRAAAGLALAGLWPALVLVGVTGWPLTRPPLSPYLSAWASTVALLGWLWLAGLALALVVYAVTRRRPTAR